MSLRISTHFGCRALFAPLMLLACLAGVSEIRADVVAARAAQYAQYADQLEVLAKQCDTENLPAAAAALRTWLPPRADDHLTLFLPPETIAMRHPASSEESPLSRIKWQDLRNRQADALLALAKQAVVEQRASLAYELIVEALRENPEHETARKMLGFVKYQGNWHTPFEVRQLRAGKVWDDRYGWLPKAHLPRYEKGERFALGRWMRADEEAQLRSEIKRGWRIETDHYVVTTNHSQEAGVQLATKLEVLHAIWRQVFAPYFINEAEMLKQFGGKAARPLPRRHEVVYFRSRDEYNEALRSSQPQIEITLGIYFDTTRTAYFFADEEQSPGTLFHEATHQLFQETRNVAPLVGKQNNFWIVEGIACYLESLTEQDGYYTLGGMNAGRMPAARHRLLTDGFYVPLAELTSLGRETIQRDQRIAMLYSQAAGLADFLMHAGGGRYRDALLKYLINVYSGRATPQALADATAQSYQTLDAEYRDFMNAGETVEQTRGVTSP